MLKEFQRKNPKEGKITHFLTEMKNSISYIVYQLIAIV